MWLVVLPLALIVGLVCGDAPVPHRGAHWPHTSPWDTHVVSGSDQRDLPCPAAEDIAPCRCIVLPDTTLELYCSDVASEDQLAQIFAGYFPSKNFTLLKIDYNQNLKVLRQGDLGDVTFQEIYITRGVLEAVQEGALSASFTTARVIHFNDNNITNFPFTQLEDFSQLKEFYIYNNNIQQFPVLKSSSLTDLHMAGNPMNDLPITAVQDLPNLERCYFFNTGVKEIHPDTFTGLPHLWIISLSENSIEHLPAGAIHLGDDITTAYLYLYNNKIKTIEVGAMAGLGNGKIYLNNNLLEELDEATFSPILNEGTKFALYDNPLSCGYDIAWLIFNIGYMGQLDGGERCSNGDLLKSLCRACPPF